MILGLDRLLARVRGRAQPQSSTPSPEPGAVEGDSEMDERIDAARVRLREQIPPLEDEE